MAELLPSVAGGQEKGRRTYTLTAEGVAACIEGTRAALERVPPMHAPVLIGMANSPMLPTGQIAESLRRRREGVAARIDSMCAARAGQKPLEAFVGAIFDHGIAMLQAELAWIDNTMLTLRGLDANV